jgi:hypothetical protein
MTSVVISILGIIIVVIIGIVVWKQWKKWNSPPENPKKNDDIKTITNLKDPPPPPMVFAVNDSGYLDLTDMNGVALDSNFGPNPKTYIGLLDLAEKDTVKTDTDGRVIFQSNVGNTKLYQVGNQSYIINYTRL